MTPEVWKPIPNTFFAYEASNLGRIRNIKTNTILSPVVVKGYHRVALSHLGWRKNLFVHRAVGAAFLGVNSQNVNHLDGNKLNNRIENLEFTTQQANIRHSYDVLKRAPSHAGERTHFAKLTDDDVRCIRTLRNNGRTYADIASRFNTKKANIWHICAGRTWKHLL